MLFSSPPCSHSDVEALCSCFAQVPGSKHRAECQRQQSSSKAYFSPINLPNFWDRPRNSTHPLSPSPPNLHSHGPNQTPQAQPFSRRSQSVHALLLPAGSDPSLGPHRSLDPRARSQCPHRSLWLNRVPRWLFLCVALRLPVPKRRRRFQCMAGLF